MFSVVNFRQIGFFFLYEFVRKILQNSPHVDAVVNLFQHWVLALCERRRILHRKSRT